MDDKEKYKRLKQKLNVICSNLVDLNECADTLKGSIDPNLSINKKNPVGNDLTGLKNSGRNTRSKIKESIIPAINSKINS